MATLMERVAVLEKQQEEGKENQKAILEKLTHIESEMTRYKGFLGGVTFLGACLVTAGTLFKEWILSHLRT